MNKYRVGVWVGPSEKKEKDGTSERVVRTAVRANGSVVFEEAKTGMYRNPREAFIVMLRRALMYLKIEASPGDVVVVEVGDGYVENWLKGGRPTEGFRREVAELRLMLDGLPCEVGFFVVGNLCSVARWGSEKIEAEKREERKLVGVASLLDEFSE